MKIKFVESSLNLRIERGKTKEDYILSPYVAEKQLSLKSHIYANVEYMDCVNSEYLSLFKKSGYAAYTVTDHMGRGILCHIKDEYKGEIISTMTCPHMMHLRIKIENFTIELITLRILVSDSSKKDYQDRRKQWDKVFKYISSLQNKSYILLTGDFNHGVISQNIENYKSKPRQYFNYQMILKDTADLNINLYPIDGTSYKEYMKIDHIITGEKIKVQEAIYKNMFGHIKEIGIPDHKSIVANLEFLK